MTWLVVAVLLWGCGFGGPCDHARGISLYATTNGTSVAGVDQATPLSLVAFWEHQSDGRREISWSILSPPLKGTTTQVDLLQGAADAGGGTLLYTFPIQNARAVNDTLFQVTTGTTGEYAAGTVTFDQLLQLMYNDPTYLEVQTDSVPSGAFRSQLGSPLFLIPPADPAVWRPLYCS